PAQDAAAGKSLPRSRRPDGRRVGRVGLVAQDFSDLRRQQLPLRHKSSSTVYLVRPPLLCLTNLPAYHFFCRPSSSLQAPLHTQGTNSAQYLSTRRAGG